MNNSFYGKTMETLRKRINIRLIINAKGDKKKYVSRQSFVSQNKIFTENCVALLEIKQVLTLNKSASLKFSILDLSKLSVYDFLFNYIKKIQF